MELTVPPALAANCRKTLERTAWLARLPDTFQILQSRWSLLLGDPFISGAGWVAPARLSGGAVAVLKVCMPHMEGEQEIQALRVWGGRCTVRVLEADELMGAMLIERCEPGTSLRVVAEPEQDLVIAKLLNTLWSIPTPPRVFRPLSAMTEYWSNETLADIGRWTDRELVREGLHAFQELPKNAPSEALLATDLHAGNVLRSEREPWLVIDPKPFMGDPAYDAHNIF